MPPSSRPTAKPLRPLVPRASRRYDGTMRARLRAALEAGAVVAPGRPAASGDRELERDVTAGPCRRRPRLAATPKACSAADIAVIGFHGQTILHRPAQRWTWQIGAGAAAGAADRHRRGQRFPQRRCARRRAGRAAWCRSITRRSRVSRAPVAVAEHRRRRERHLCRPRRRAHRFRHRSRQRPDRRLGAAPHRQADRRGRRLARAGRVHDDVVAAQLAHPYFAKPAPKSLDRMDFACRHGAQS